MMTGRTWESHNWRQDTLGARNFILNEYWNNFVHQWQLERVTVNFHANTQPKSVLSFALTVMGKVLAWDWDRKGIGSRFAACMSIYTKAVLCDQRMRPRMVTERDGRQRLEGDLEQRMQAIVESVNWVCEDLFKEEHEWVTQLTMSESIVTNLGGLGLQS